MKKKTLFLILLGLLVLLAPMTAFAREKLPAPTNIKLEGTTLSWDAVPNASSYQLSVICYYTGSNSSTGLTTSNNSIDLKNTMENMAYKAQTTDETVYFTFAVMAKPADTESYASSGWSDYTEQYPFAMPQREKLPTPANIKLEGTTLTWDAVPEASSYQLSVICYYTGSNSSTGLTTGNNSIDLKNAMEEMAYRAQTTDETVYFTFAVIAYAADPTRYITSDWSAYTERYPFAMPQREKLSTPANLRLNGTTLSWNAVPNASSYFISIVCHYTNGPSSSSLTSDNPSINLADAMRHLAYGASLSDGDVSFSFAVQARPADSTHYATSDLSAYTQPRQFYIADGHFLIQYSGVAATCTTAGSMEYWQCVDCGKLFTDNTCAAETTLADTVIPAAGHHMEHHVAVPASLTADGNIEYWHCTVCGKNFTDENGKTEVSSVSVPATGSNEKINLSKPKSMKLTAVSAKKIKVSWKKLSSKDKKKIRKIQIQVSLDKSFSKLVKEKIVSSGKTSWTIPGLKKNTKYFVRIRAYTKSGNVINASKWVVKSKKTNKK